MRSQREREEAMKTLAMTHFTEVARSTSRDMVYDGSAGRGFGRLRRTKDKKDRIDKKGPTWKDSRALRTKDERS